MSISFIHKLLIIAVFIILASCNAFAMSMEVRPEKVIPGDVFLVKITSARLHDTEVRFNDKTVPHYSLNDSTIVSLIPVDLNTAPGTYKVEVRDGKETITSNILIGAHEFRTINLTLPEGKVTLSPENQSRVEKEYILQQGIWRKSTEPAWQGNFTYPLETEISTEFGVRRIMNKKKTSVHRGMDFRGKTGTPVKSLNSGYVVLAQDLFYGGNTLVVDHGMGLYSIYMHLSGFKVKEGTKVNKGDIVGLVGSSGRATGPHLHLSVKLNGVSVNPESLFKLKL